MESTFWMTALETERELASRGLFLTWQLGANEYTAQLRAGRVPEFHLPSSSFSHPDIQIPAFVRGWIAAVRDPFATARPCWQREGL